MATITNKDIIDELIKNDGYYMDDPRIFMIVEYTNFTGHKVWGITHVNENPEFRLRYLIETPYVKKPKVIWHFSKESLFMYQAVDNLRDWGFFWLVKEKIEPLYPSPILTDPLFVILIQGQLLTYMERGWSPRFSALCVIGTNISQAQSVYIDFVTEHSNLH